MKPKLIRIKKTECRHPGFETYVQLWVIRGGQTIYGACGETLADALKTAHSVFAGYRSKP